MKKSVKNLSIFLAALTMSSAFAVTASAINDDGFIKVNSGSDKGGYAIDEDYAVYEDGGYFFKGYYYLDENAIVDEAVKKVTDTGETGYVLKNDNSWIKTNTKSVLPTTSSTVYVTKPAPTLKPSCTYTDYSTIYNYKYYSTIDAKKELENYFEANTYDFFMYEDDERFFCSDVYFISTDSDVVYYDYAEEKLVANEAGNAYVYIYTKGGVPFFRLNVSVTRTRSTSDRYSTIELIPDEWHLDNAGDTTGFVIKCDKKYSADDFKLTIEHGSDIASIVKGELKTTGTGPIVVRVSNKKNANIYGEALIYVGKYISSIYDGYYTTSGNKITTSYWDYDISDALDYYIKGWIKSDEGTMIPVFKKSTGTVLGADGTLKETTILSYRNTSIIDLLRDAYGDKDDLYDAILKYNLFKKTGIN